MNDLKAAPIEASDFPPWIQLEVQLAQPDLIAAIRGNIVPIFDALDQSGWVASRTFMPFYKKAILITIEPTGISMEEALSRLGKICASYVDGERVSGTKSTFFRGFPQQIMGGPGFTGMMQRWGDAHSRALIAAYAANNWNENIQPAPFTMAVTQIILETLRLDPAWRRKVLLDDIAVIQPIIQMGKGDPGWEKAYQSFSSRIEVVREGFEIFPIDLEKLGLFEEPIIEVLERFRGDCRRIFGSAEPMRSPWNIPSERAISKGIVHQSWLRTVGDNYLESIAISWLESLIHP